MMRVILAIGLFYLAFGMTTALVTVFALADTRVWPLRHKVMLVLWWPVVLYGFFTPYKGRH